jgi:hypothetical protein
MIYPFRPLTWTSFLDERALSKSKEVRTLPEWAEQREAELAPDKSGLKFYKMADFGDKRTAKHCLRFDANMNFVDGAKADYDQGKISLDEAAALAYAANIQCGIETSASHTPDAPRFHVITPFSEPLAPCERNRHVDWLNGVFGDIFDPASWNLSQGFRCGRTASNPHYRFIIVPGTPINLLGNLAATAIGRPRGNGAGPRLSAGPLSQADIEAFKERIRTGADYHDSTLSLIGYCLQQGTAPAARSPLRHRPV